MNENQLRRRIRAYIIFFICAILVSGITTFPIETELAYLVEHDSLIPNPFRDWFATVYEAVRTTNAQYPYLAYGVDWLGWAHCIIAIMFIGPLRDPVRNIWVIQWGIIACLLVFPLALIAGHIREVPFYWRLVDCSLGLFGLLPLTLCLKDIKRLEVLEARTRVVN